jgi:hypothetical protein
MPKATNRVTANRVHFSRLERAHLNLIQSLTVLFPPRIVGQADAADIESRADHLQQVFRAVIRYEEAVIADTAERIAGPHRGKVAEHLWDAISEPDWDIVAALERAGVRFNPQAEAA